MEQYISKSALIAKIEKLKGKVNDDSSYCNGWQHALRILELSLYSFEVKEVDLEKVFNDEYSKFSNDTDAMDYAFPIDLADYKDFAKHFFELGIAVSNKAQKGE